MSHVTRSLLVLVLVLGLAAAGTHAQTTWYVDPAGDDTNSGMSSGPTGAFEHLDYAINTIASAGDTVLVAPGTYDVATNGDTFPVTVPSGVTVTGTGTVSNPCLIGGDANVGPGADVPALFIIGGTGSTVMDVTIEGLAFLGEDSAGRDSPSGILINADAFLSNIVVEDCVFSRGEMNDASTDDRACILLTGSEGASGVTIESNRITANEHGGIEFLGNTGVDVSVSFSSTTIIDNEIGVPFGDDTVFGIRWNGIDRSISGNANIIGNLITGKWTSGGSTGMSYGIDIFMDADDSPSGGVGIALFNVGTMEENVITGCVVDGIRLSADGVLSSNTTPNITVRPIERNYIAGCGGAGIHHAYDADGNDDGAGYLNVHIEGNILVENGHGLKFSGFASTSTGSSETVNNTIADNVRSGIGFLDQTPPLLTQSEFETLYPTFLNNIIYFNRPLMGGGYGTQVVATNSTVTGWFPALTSHCDWQGGSLVNNNIDSDPRFIDAANDDYRLDTTPTISPCVDAGLLVATEVLADEDIDGDDRDLDGDWDCTPPADPVVDIGADEVPEPDCGT